jgi:hypothetical protein
LNYSQIANYADVEGITVSAIYFDRTAGFNFSPESHGFLEYTGQKVAFLTTGNVAET